MTNNSHLVAGPDGKLHTYAGPDAVQAFRAIVLAASLKLYVTSNGRIIPTRGVGITKMLAMATEYTGKKYKRKEAAQAAEDVLKWANEMKAALPVVRG